MIVTDADRAGDVDALLAMNNSAVPNVNALDQSAFTALAGWGRLRVARAEEGAEPLGFVLTLPPGIPYDSLNYAWFIERYSDFEYVDRIVVSAAARGMGVGGQLYADVTRYAAQTGRARVCAEVNTEPPNPGSMAFHKGLGFRVLEERHNPSNDKTVAMLEKPTAADA